ncbi:hypothetical protein FRC06_002449 [Ceratobasidium sp. 370]|nr:hypothetical protein FRC06_002449 [Ceratobasidium sp. 370]
MHRELGQHLVNRRSKRQAHSYRADLSTNLGPDFFHDIGGRMYPLDPELPIFFPQDELESHRLDHQHLALKFCIGSNYVGPVALHLQHDPQGPRKRVLDVGTQQGSWVQEMATEFPRAEFVSLDVSPMAAHIPPLIRELHRVLKPGGLFLSGELENEAYGAADPDKPLGDAVPRLSRGLRLLREALAAQGVMHDAGRRLPGMLADPELFVPKPASSFAYSMESDSESSSGRSFSSVASSSYCTPSIPPRSSAASDNFTPLPPAFINITARTFPVPATPWPNYLSSPALHQSGRQSTLTLRKGWPSLVPLLTTCVGLSADDAHEIAHGALADYFIDPALQLVTNYHTVWAIKA